jgi:hypothetical protein
MAACWLLLRITEKVSLCCGKMSVEAILAALTLALYTQISLRNFIAISRDNKIIMCAP